MQSQKHQLGDVLLILLRSEEHVARIAGFIDSLDASKPFYVNLRISDNKRWGERIIKIEASQIVRDLPDWQAEHNATFEASIKEAAESAYARMSPEQRAQLDARS